MFNLNNSRRGTGMSAHNTDGDHNVIPAYFTNPCTERVLEAATNARRRRDNQVAARAELNGGDVVRGEVFAKTPRMPCLTLILRDEYSGRPIEVPTPKIASHIQLLTTLPPTPPKTSRQQKQTPRLPSSHWMAATFPKLVMRPPVNPERRVTITQSAKRWWPQQMSSGRLTSPRVGPATQWDRDFVHRLRNMDFTVSGSATQRRM